MREFIDITKNLFEQAGRVDGVSTVGPVTFDQINGIGQVPYNQDIVHFGFAVLMKPSQFQSLAAPRDFSESSNIEGLVKALKDGKAFGSPFLKITFDKGIPEVVAHEGRTRVEAIKKVYGPSASVLVHIIVRSIRAKNITLEQIAAFRAEAIPEDASKSIKGPFFGDQVWLQGGWKTLPN